MEECNICLSIPVNNNWKELNCSHKMCFSCFLKLQKQTCPFCRSSFKYTQSEIKLRKDLNINYISYNPPSQLNNMNELLDSFNQLNTNDDNYNIPFSRINRNRIRKRRKNLSEDELNKRRKNIKERCKRKWTNKENRLKKWYNIII
jgi:hypothetical protein